MCHDRIGIMFKLDHSYASLPAHFYARLNPVPVHAPSMLKFNDALAKALGLDARMLDGELGAALFSGNQLPDAAVPIAMAYAGHQFGGFVPQLGDGRAILLGEITDNDGNLRDIHLKGSGRTPFSRQGDGRATLPAVMREYIISEAMHALGIPTTRSLAIVTTGETVYRHAALPGAILTRVAASHIRVGTFEYFAARGDHVSLKILADYAINRHYPALKEASHPYYEFLKSVLNAQVCLITKWMQVGFIHGVMNTDNMLISGETIDYGPCAFMDTYNPMTVFSSIDRHGRYSWKNQAPIAQWNVLRFAETLLPLLDSDENKAIDLASEVMSTFSEEFEHCWLKGMCSKLGLQSSLESDAQLIQDLLDIMYETASDYTETFSKLSLVLEEGRQHLLPAYYDWIDRWLARRAQEHIPIHASIHLMRSINPMVIPRNDYVEEALSAALNDDFSKFESLITVLATPFECAAAHDAYRKPPMPSSHPYQTFCGT